MTVLNTILVGFLLFILWMTGIPQYGWAWAKYLFKRYWPGSRREFPWSHPGTTTTTSTRVPNQPDTYVPLGGGWKRKTKRKTKPTPPLTDEQARKAIDKLFEGYVDPIAVKRELMRKKLEDD